MFQTGIESSCQSVKPKNIYLGLNYFCQLPCKLTSQSQTPHGQWKERLRSMTPRVGSVGLLCDPGAVSAPANASICFQSSGCHLKSLRFIAPGSVSCLSPAADARNWVKVSPLEVLSYTELEELQLYPCMSWQSATHYMHQRLSCFPSTASFSGKKKISQKCKKLWKVETHVSQMVFL